MRRLLCFRLDFALIGAFRPFRAMISPTQNREGPILWNRLLALRGEKAGLLDDICVTRNPSFRIKHFDNPNSPYDVSTV